jgi:hypothetical protein
MSMDDFSDLIPDKKKEQEEFSEEAEEWAKEWNEFFNDWKKKHKEFYENKSWMEDAIEEIEKYQEKLWKILVI